MAPGPCCSLSPQTVETTLRLTSPWSVAVGKIPPGNQRRCGGADSDPKPPHLSGLERGLDARAYVAKKDKDKKRTSKQRKWEAENKQIQEFRTQAPKIKAFARARGCTLRFFEYLDSYEDEFNAIAKDAPARFQSLVGVFELDEADYIKEDRTRYGIEADWERVLFKTEAPLAETYNDPDPDANLNGKTQAFLTPGGQLKTVVLIPRQIKCPFEHRDHKYHFKLIALCHELGHVDDLEKRINLDPEGRRADIIQAEVYAHLFALTEANSRDLIAVAVTLESSLANYKAAPDYRGEVARRVLAQYHRPDKKTWHEYTEQK
jgi:hypothetical protein